MARKPARRQEISGRGAEEHDQRLRDHARLQAADERVTQDRVRGRATKMCRRRDGKDREARQTQEQQIHVRDRRDDAREERPLHRGRYLFFFTRGRKPYWSIRAWPRLLSTFLTNI